MGAIDEQLVDLQSQLAFQEDTLLALNEIVTRQQQQIDALEQQLALHRDKLVELMDMVTDRSATVVSDERPPHY